MGIFQRTRSIDVVFFQWRRTPGVFSFSWHSRGEVARGLVESESSEALAGPAPRHLGSVLAVRGPAQSLQVGGPVGRGVSVERCVLFRDEVSLCSALRSELFYPGVRMRAFRSDASK